MPGQYLPPALGESGSKLPGDRRRQAAALHIDLRRHPSSTQQQQQLQDAPRDAGHKG
jgi:hypothetical protein